MLAQAAYTAAALADARSTNCADLLTRSSTCWRTLWQRGGAPGAYMGATRLMLHAISFNGRGSLAYHC